MSYTSMNYHVVFSTKDRKPFLQDEHLAATCQYIGGIVRNVGGSLLAANGQADHIHLAVVIPPKENVSQVVGKIKANSSGWLRQTCGQMNDFRWQDGYAAFTVSLSGLPQVRRYFDGQAEHHKKMTFEDELVKLLDKHGIEYDVNALWA